MGRDTQADTSFMQGLLHDRTANTLAICAAALFPLMAMVGSGVDASRYYMTLSRLQAACDAGALASRRAMTDDTFNQSHKTIGLNFFDQNFRGGMFGLDGLERDYTSNGEGVVIGEASGTLDTTLMDVFGFEDFELEVSCTAEINISNTDIMFVLDTTGSMAECPNGSDCGAGPGSKIVGLRSAVMNFYDTVEDATSDSAQVRYGFVPYSQQVNVGFSIPQNFMATRHTYQARVARFAPANFPNEAQPDVREIGDPILISDQVEWLPRATNRFNSTNIDHYRFRTDGSNRTSAENFCFNTLPRSYTVTVSGVAQTWQVFAPTEFVTGQWSGGSSNNQAGCRGRVRKTRPATAADVNAQFVDWRYCEVDTSDDTPCDVVNPPRSPAGWETVNLSTLYDDNRISLPTGTNGAMETHTWSGCIEEPVWMDPNGNYAPVAPEAHDLNVNLLPINEAQRWKPALDRLVWERRDAANNRITAWRDTNTGQARPGWVCPRPARKLAEIARTDLQNYVNNLTPSGNTYHDIGMLWGVRFASPRGLFRTENEFAPNGDAISRHIVFMTDGLLVTNVENYSTQGIEWWDRRVTGNGDGGRESTRRAARLQAICNTAKAEGITVWVVAFGTSMTSNLKTCASPGRDYQANDSAALNSAFQEIAQKIAALRITS